MPRAVTFPGASNLWMPLVRTSDLQQRDVRNLTMFGRLAGNATLGSARAELSAIAGRLADEFPATNEDVGVLVQNFSDRFNGSETKLVFRSLLGAVAFVLLIACANVANLLLARAVGRSREISIRTTLGRESLARCTSVARGEFSPGDGCGDSGVAHRGVGRSSLRCLALVPAVKPPYIDFAMDARVLGYFVAITAGAGILCGLAPVVAAIETRYQRRSEGRQQRGRLQRAHAPPLRAARRHRNVAGGHPAGGGRPDDSQPPEYVPSGHRRQHHTRALDERQPARDEVPARRGPGSLLRSSEGPARNTPRHRGRGSGVRPARGKSGRLCLRSRGDAAAGLRESSACERARDREGLLPGSPGEGERGPPVQRHGHGWRPAGRHRERALRSSSPGPGRIRSANVCDSCELGPERREVLLRRRTPGSRSLAWCRTSCRTTRASCSRRSCTSRSISGRKAAWTS